MGEKRLIELRYYLASPFLNPGRQSISIFIQSRSNSFFTNFLIFKLRRSFCGNQMSASPQTYLHTVFRRLECEFWLKFAPFPILWKSIQNNSNKSTRAHGLFLTNLRKAVLTTGRQKSIIHQSNIDKYRTIKWVEHVSGENCKCWLAVTLKNIFSSSKSRSSI